MKLDPSIHDRVRVEQMRMLFEAPFPGMVLATVFACAFAWEMRGEVADQILALWLGLKFVAVAPRAVHAYAFSRRQSDSLTWLSSGLVLFMLDGLAWGSAGVLMMVPDDRATITAVAASLSCVAAVAAFAIQADWRACAAFTAGTVGPTIAYLLWRADSFGLYGASGIGTFLILLLAAGRRSERHVVELLALRFRTASLTQQLQEALERTEQESRAKDVFVANMSHELRTPLHGILGLSRALARRAVPGDRETIALIQKSGEHLLGLINNILEFSRFRARGIDHHPTEIEVVRVVEEAAALFAPSAQERKIGLTTRIGLPAPFVTVADQSRLRQILMNLLGNAIKFTGPGGSVTLDVRERAAPEGIVISVSDTGIGIDAQTMSQLFEPFRQGDSSTSRRHGGTGLGLHITREICRAMGGAIRCSSSPGKGSVFTVELPFRRAVAAPTVGRPAAAAAPDSGYTFERAAAGHVLLAEDNEVNALVAEAALTRFGLTVEVVQTGHQVVRRLNTLGERPDLVLLDCQMPELDGYDACRRVRAFERENGLSPIAIVALTANVFPQDRERCREAGMDGFLGKPFTDQELRQVLETFAVLGTAEGAHQASPAAG